MEFVQDVFLSTPDEYNLRFYKPYTENEEMAQFKRVS